MATRTILKAGLIGIFSIIASCAPTKAGLEARQMAKDRMGLMTAQIHYGQAKQCFETGQFDRASRELEHALEIYDKSPAYYVLQGRICLETHKLDSALHAFETASQKDPKLADPYYYSGVVYQRWSDDQDAQQSYMRAFELAPTKVEYLLAAAESLISLANYDQAKELIDSKLSYFEHNAALHQLKGQIALLQGDPKTAVELYGQARLLNPDDQSLLEELTWAQYAAELYGECYNSLGQLAENSKTQRSDLILLQARCLNMMDRSIEAREKYLDLSRLRPSDPTIWSELGTVAWNLGDYRRVAQSSVQLIALAPDRYEGYLLRGINERHKGNVSEAVRFLTQASKLSPDIALPHLLLGQALEQTGDLDGALRAYGAATNAEPDNTEAQDLLRRLNEGQDDRRGDLPKRLSSAQGQ